MRCLFKHKWSRKTFDGSSFYVRTCKGCGTVQRGIYGTWETIREYAYVKSEQRQIVRQPSSPGDQLAHALGLRHTRISDSGDQETAPDRTTVSSLGSDGEPHPPVQRPWAERDAANRLAAPVNPERLAERRRSKRIHVALPVILENESGVTRDVSASGVFFWKSGTFIYGESVSFSMGRKTESGNFTLKCRGIVTRTEPRGSDVGVAMRITEKAMEPMYEGAIADREDVSEIRLGVAA
jgi:hypothetical protein